MHSRGLCGQAREALEAQRRISHVSTGQAFIVFMLERTRNDFIRRFSLDVRREDDGDAFSASFVLPRMRSLAHMPSLRRLVRTPSASLREEGESTRVESGGASPNLLSALFGHTHGHTAGGDGSAPAPLFNPWGRLQRATGGGGGDGDGGGGGGGGGGGLWRSSGALPLPALASVVHYLTTQEKLQQPKLKAAGGQPVHVSFAPEPSDIFWEVTARTLALPLP